MRISGIAEAHFEQAQKSVHVWLIVIAEAFFFLHRRALIVEIFLRDTQRTHAITFQPKRQWQLAGRQSLEIVGALAGSGAVHGAAGVRDVLKMRSLGYVF